LLFDDLSLHKVNNLQYNIQWSYVSNKYFLKQKIETTPDAEFGMMKDGY
jgi:hypothetical protein